MDDEASQLEDLERIMNDTNAEPIRLSYSLLKSITNNFSNEIGHGGFGVVYQGVLQNGVVAVKKLLNLQALPEKQFLEELTCLKLAKHKNIVRFLGYCSERQEELVEFNGKNVLAEVQQKLLCFEYVSNGNIKDYLQQDKSEGNNWSLRYQMIRGICQGLQFLHGEVLINHLDLKPENVMLDAHLEPKITDFGISRFLDQGQSKVITQNIIGTRRYMAPETIDHGEISFKSDVYALGIIIIELLTGIDKIDLDNWEQSLDDVECPQISLCAEIARNCTDRDRHNRPTVLEVIRDLDELDLLHPAAGSPWINQVTPSVFAGTELVGLCPLELSFPFVPNQEMRCHMSLTNKTDTSIYCLINQERHKLPSMHTRAITLSRKPEEELPSDMDNYEIELLVARCDEVEDMADQLLGFREASEGLMFVLGLELPLPRNLSFKDSFSEIQGSLELHTALLTASAVAPSSALLKRVLWTNKGPRRHHLIDAMDAHPTEPWVLVVESPGRRVYIYNWQTGGIRQEYITKTANSRRKMVAKFIARKEWAVIGRPDGSITVLACPNMNRINEFDAHYEAITSLVVHPTRSYLLSSCSMFVKILDWNRGWTCVGRFNVPGVFLNHIMFAPKHATSCVSFHVNGTAMMWGIGHPKPITEFYQPYIHVIPFTCTGDRHFIAAIEEGRVIIWDLQEQRKVHILNTTEDIKVAVCHPTRPILATAANNGFIHVWDSITYRLKAAYESVISSPQYISFAGSRRIVIGNIEGIAVLDIDE